MDSRQAKLNTKFWGTGYTYISRECIAIKIPSVKEFHTLTSLLSPWIAVCQRSIESESKDADSQESHDASPSNRRGIPNSESASKSVGREIVYLAQCNNGEIKSWEVVVEEKLTLHEIERKVMKGPAQDRSANFIVKALEVDAVVVIESSLPAKNR